VYLAYNNTIQGAARAVNERLFYINEDGKCASPPVPNPETFMKRLKSFTKAFKAYSQFCLPIERSAYPGLFTGRKKERYTLAVEELSRRAICVKDAFLKFFMKYETYNFTIKRNPVPRGINPRFDEYLVEAGRYIKPLENKTFKIVAKLFGYLVVMKCYNMRRVAEILYSHWSEFEDPVAIMADASRFEQCVSVIALMWEHAIYKLFYPGDKYFAKLMKWQLNNIGKARAPDGRLSFKIDGKRASGDPNTALGNTLLTAAMAYAYLEYCKITKHRFFCNGDDAGFIIERKDLAKFMEGAKQWYREMGFRMKFEKAVDVFEEIDFCQARPVITSDGPIMVRNVINGISKDCMSKKDLSKKIDFEAWCSAVGQGGCSIAGGIPIYQSFYCMMERAGKGTAPMKNVFDEYHLENKYRNMREKVKTIDDQARYSFWKAFGITPDCQIVIEEHYDSTELVHGLKEHDLVYDPVLPW